MIDSSLFLDPEPPRILLAEDDDDQRALVAAGLRRDGYFVLEAKDGIRLRQLMSALLSSPQTHPRPELVITDLHMPGLSGLEVVAWFRDRGWTTPVILVSGFADGATRRAAEELGVTLVLDKPLDLLVFRRQVQELVPTRRTRQTDCAKGAALARS